MTRWKISNRAVCGLANSCQVNVCWNHSLDYYIWQLLLITVKLLKLNLALLECGICIWYNKNLNDTENSHWHGEQLWIVPWHLKCGKCHHLWAFLLVPHTCSCTRVSRSEDAPIQAKLHSKAAIVHHSRAWIETNDLLEIGSTDSSYFLLLSFLMRNVCVAGVVVEGAVLHQYPIPQLVASQEDDFKG